MVIRMFKKTGIGPIVTLILDICGLIFSFAAGSLIAIHFSTEQINTFYYNFLWGIPLILAIFIASFEFFRIYKIIWRYAGFIDLLKLIVLSGANYVIFFILHYFAVSASFYPLSAYVIGYFITAFLIISIRAVPYLLEKHTIHQSGKNTDAMKGNIMIIGAGNAANILISDITNNTFVDHSLLKCLIDDDKSKHGLSVGGIRVYGGRDKIQEAVEKFGIKSIFFAIPSCSPEDRRDILSICARTGCTVRTMPNICELVNNNVSFSDVRNINIEDLLGRDPIKLDVSSAREMIIGKTVLVTGGGGSIGSELCRQIATLSPRRLIIFDVYENNAYDIQNELRQKYPTLDLVTLIGSVRDSKRLDCLFSKYRPAIVFHAAAHKHVPLMEDSPNEAIKNNVIGTYKTAVAASRYGVEKFVLISTDKAVNPTNIMGASKRMCEMIIQSINKTSDTDFAAVRFGNVLGSNGSVVPFFKKQIEQGGPVTVTHPDIIRYFMTIPEAVSLVLTAGTFAHGGEIFVLDMGEPVKILDLAENLIRLSGHTPYEDIKIVFTGLRPGEKLYEELLMAEEGLKDTENKLIHIGKPVDFDEEVFLRQLEQLKDVMYNDNIDIKSYIKEIVSTYHPDSNG